MHAAELMTRVIHTCLTTDSLAEAARIMWERDVGWLPVLTPEGRLVSVVTDRDICMGALFRGVGLSDARVDGVMSRRLVTCFPDDEVGDVERTFRREQLRRLPVVDREGRLVGVVTVADVVRALEREVDAAELAMRSDHRRHATDGGVGGVSALTEIVDTSRALYESCSHALEAVDTLAAIAEPRGPNSGRAGLRNKLLTDCAYAYGTPEGDNVWMYE